MERRQDGYAFVFYSKGAKLSGLLIWGRGNLHLAPPLAFVHLIINWIEVNLTLRKQTCCLRADFKSVIPVPVPCAIPG